METASVWIVISNSGNNVPKNGITPAEAILLRNKLKPVVGGNPVTQIKITGTAKVAIDWEEREIKNAKGVPNGQTENVPVKFRDRTSEDEYNRLVMKYGEDAVQKAWPGDPSGVTLPETFAKAGFEEGAGWQQERKVDSSRRQFSPKPDEHVFVSQADE